MTVKELMEKLEQFEADDVVMLDCNDVVGECKAVAHSWLYTSCILCADEETAKMLWDVV